MTITINTSAEIEETITQGSMREGVTPEEYALRAISFYAHATDQGGTDSRGNHAPSPILPPGTTYAGVSVEDNPLAALFAQWRVEDATDDSQEIARRQQEGDAFMERLEAGRLNIARDPGLLAVLEIDNPEDGEKSKS